MPPRYAYWTIIVDNQPTAFRSGSQEELMPTFNRLKAKNDTAVMMWFQIGKLWPSRIDAQEFMRARGEMGRKGDDRQPARRSFSEGGAGSSFRDRERGPSRPALSERRESKGEPSTPAPARNTDDKLDWKPKGEFVPAPKRADRAEWKPKGAFTPAPRRSEGSDWKSKPSRSEDRPRSFKRPDFKSSGDDTRAAKPEWKPKGSFDRESKPDWKSKALKPQSPRAFEKPAWKPKGSFDRERKPEWKPSRDVGGRFSSPGGERAPRGEKPEWKPKGSFDRAPSRSERPEWKPKGSVESSSPQAFKPLSPEKRKWVPKEEYKRSMGIEAKRDSKWRPGGEHKDPRQKYKDAKKAKWTKFKKNIRARSGGKGKKSS